MPLQQEKLVVSIPTGWRDYIAQSVRKFALGGARLVHA
jgi:hypothetical protein